MNSVPELIQAVEENGGRFMVDGGRLGIIPATAATLLMEELRQHKAELLAELARRRNSSAHVQTPSPSAYTPEVSSPPDVPPGVRMVRWEPLPAPVQITRYSTVTNTEGFIDSTLRQLGARLRGDDWGAGNWSCTELLARLDACGCVVALDDPRLMLQ